MNCATSLMTRNVKPAHPLPAVSILISGCKCGFPPPDPPKIIAENANNLCVNRSEIDACRNALLCATLRTTTVCKPRRRFDRCVHVYSVPAFNDPLRSLRCSGLPNVPKQFSVCNKPQLLLKPFQTWYCKQKINIRWMSLVYFVYRLHDNIN